MLEVDYIILCEVADHTPQGTNLINVFQVIHAQEFPVSFGTRLAHVVLRALKPVYGTDFKCKIVVEDSDKAISTDEVVLPKLQALKDFCVPIDIDFPKLVFEKPGKYFFKIYIDDELKNSTILHVRSIGE